MVWSIPTIITSKTRRQKMISAFKRIVKILLEEKGYVKKNVLYKKMKSRYKITNLGIDLALVLLCENLVVSISKEEVRLKDNGYGRYESMLKDNQKYEDMLMSRRASKIMRGR